MATVGLNCEDLLVSLCLFNGVDSVCTRCMTLLVGALQFARVISLSGSSKNNDVDAWVPRDGRL